MIRVFVADDHAILRDGIRRLLAETHDLECAGEAGTAAEVLALAATEKWDVLVLDLSFPDGAGLDVIKRVRALRPRLPILVLTMQAEDAYAVRVLAAGASGFLTKGRPATMMLEAIRRLAGGGRYITPELVDLLLVHPIEPGRAPHEALTDRQIEVLMFVGAGKSPSEIASLLSLRASTVSSHLQQIKQKLSIQTIGGLAQYALKAGLVHH